MTLDATVGENLVTAQLYEQRLLLMYFNTLNYLIFKQRIIFNK